MAPRSRSRAARRRGPGIRCCAGATVDQGGDRGEDRARPGCAGDRARGAGMGQCTRRSGPLRARRSTVALADDRHAQCLVIEHVDGHAPDTDDGWVRLGETLASLAELPTDHCPLSVHDAVAFTAAHDRRVAISSLRVHKAMADVAQSAWLTSPHPPAIGPLVLTHGDPGPGDFLDNGRAGILIDWEEAKIASRGLDLARAIFIALLGAGPSGFVARDHHARARSVTAGYSPLSATPGGPARRSCDRGSPSPRSSSSTVAGSAPDSPGPCLGRRRSRCSQPPFMKTKPGC